MRETGGRVKIDKWINLVIILIKNMSVIIVLAYVLTRTEAFNEILQKRINYRHKLALIGIFGLFSIYGTLSGEYVLGVTINIRDMGPAIAGLIGGPLVGLGAGLIGGLHRYTMGGITCLGCSISTVVAGLAGGLIYYFRQGRLISVTGAVVFGVLMETFHMGFSLMVSRPYDLALAAIKVASLPMIISNALGLGIFTFIVANLIKERHTEAVKELIEGELKVAREIQMSIIPKIFPPFPDRAEFDIYGVLEPAKEVGGDLYDFFLLDDDHLCFTVGDVSGKGVPASLFMAVTKTLIKATATRDMAPDEILSRVNDNLCQDNDSGMFVTEFLGILHIPSGQVVYANGGHNLPYIVRKDGSFGMLQKTSGMALGVMEGLHYGQNSIKLNNGDTLLLYTDGVTEAMDTQGELFTESRLEDVFAKFPESTAREQALKVLEAVKLHASGAQQSDDITILALKYKVG
ncbi:PP2C family protein-serine/threonine phosphatase [Syntrophomonas palmitatica]|uniref:PP2C family protein-serine/threonine phosphatase n=1 Tax=Syntrophomonas palmitatica TaxID=402877 RepID=UPI000AFB2C93|nr:SpoIIE family protein phosphatase [Syntrophomonas palmitatica]